MDLDVENVLIQIRIRVVDSACEPTIHTLGQTALIQIANAKWFGTKFTKLDRIHRYHAHMISLGRLFFPTEKIRATVTKCSARASSEESRLRRY